MPDTHFKNPTRDIVEACMILRTHAIHFAFADTLDKYDKSKANSVCRKAIKVIIWCVYFHLVNQCVKCQVDRYCCLQARDTCYIIRYRLSFL